MELLAMPSSSKVHVNSGNFVACSLLSKLPGDNYRKYGALDGKRGYGPREPAKVGTHSRPPGACRSWFLLYVMQSELRFLYEITRWWIGLNVITLLNKFSLWQWRAAIWVRLCNSLCWFYQFCSNVEGRTYKWDVRLCGSSVGKRTNSCNWSSLIGCAVCISAGDSGIWIPSVRCARALTLFCSYSWR